MGIGYHARSLSKDVADRASCVVGVADIAVIREALAKRREAGEHVDAELDQAVEQLGQYFLELREALGDAAGLASRQAFMGELLGEAEALALSAAVSIQVRTTIDKRVAKKLADLIFERTKGWPDP